MLGPEPAPATVGSSSPAVPASNFQVNAVRCVKNEIHNMLAALRHHSRAYGRTGHNWASEERFEREILADQESPVLRSFKDLQTYLDGFDDLRRASAPRFLAPFLAIVRSDAADASVTMAALRSLNKFLLYGFVAEGSPGARQAINDLAHTLPRCRRFTESVLMLLLDVTDLCVQNSAGRLVTNDNMHDLFQVCFRICQNKQRSYSKLLQQSAGSTLAHIIICVFSRLGQLCEQETSTGSETPSGSAKNANVLLSPVQTLGKSHTTRKKLGIVKKTINESNVNINNINGRTKSYGTSCLYRIMRFLVAQANPSAKAAAAAAAIILSGGGGDEGGVSALGVPNAASENDGDHGKPGELQILALGMINTVLETAGEQLGAHMGMIKLIQGDLCKFLLQSSQTDEPILLSLVLRTIFNMFCAVKAHLKVQFEVFFTSIHMGIIESSIPSSPSSSLSLAARGKMKATKELALESLLDFCREPVLMVDLYTNYDCDVQCSNLFEMLVRSLCAGSAPSLTNIDLSKCGEKVKVKNQVHGNSDASSRENNTVSLPTSSSAIRAAIFGSSGIGATGSVATGHARSDSSSDSGHHYAKSGAAVIPLGQLTSLHALAFECLLEVVNSIARRCQTSHDYEQESSRERGYTIVEDAARRRSATPVVVASSSSSSSSTTTTTKLALSRSNSVSSTASTTRTEDGVSPTELLDRNNKAASDEYDSRVVQFGVGFDASPLRTSSRSHLPAGQADRTLRKQKRRKIMLADAAARFNAKPRKGIAFALQAGLVDCEESVEENNFRAPSPSSTSQQLQQVFGTPIPVATADAHLQSPSDISPVGEIATSLNNSSITGVNAASKAIKQSSPPPKKPKAVSVARFLHETPGLDKSVVGDYLAEPPDSHPFNTKVRAAYVARFDFSGMTFDGALRLFLSGFRLPGEAQKIDRLMEAFAGRLYEQVRESLDAKPSPEEEISGCAPELGVSCMKSAQALFVLCFSTIMLNTDLHNPNIKPERKMTFEAFKKNNRGINDGEDVPSLFLERLYHNIKTREIRILPSTLDNDKSSRSNRAATVATWDGLMQRQSSVEAAAFTPASVGRQAQLRVRAGVHEHDMFELIAAAAYEAIETVFNTTRNTSLRRRALNGFKNYAIVASYYGLQEHFDRLLILLCRQFVGLSSSGANGDDPRNTTGGKLFAAAQRAEEAAKARRSDKIRRMQERVSANLHEAKGVNACDGAEVEMGGELAAESSIDVNTSATDHVDEPGFVSSNRAQSVSARSSINDGLTRKERQMLRDRDSLLNSRAMLLISCIASLTREHGHMVRHGWRKVAQCVVLLFELGALPRDLTRMPWSLTTMDDIVKRRDAKRFRRNRMRRDSETKSRMRTAQRNRNSAQACDRTSEEDDEVEDEYFMGPRDIDYDSQPSSASSDEEESHETANAEGGGLLSWVFGLGGSSGEAERRRRSEHRRIIRRLRRSISQLDLGDLFDLSRTLPKEAVLELTTALIVIRDPRLNFRHGSAFSRNDASGGSDHSLQQDKYSSGEAGNSGGSTNRGAEGKFFGDMLIPGTLDGPQYLRKFERGSMLCVDLLCRVVCSNPHRLMVVWRLVRAYFNRLLGGESEEPAVRENNATGVSMPPKSPTSRARGRHLSTYLSPASAKPDTPQNPPASRVSDDVGSGNNNDYNEHLGAFVREKMPGLCGRIVMCVLACIHRLIHRVPVSTAVVLLSSLQGVVHRVPLADAPELATAVGSSTLQLLMQNASSLLALGQRDPEGIWGRLFQHLDWIVFVERCRPSVWQCLVFMIKGTLTSADTAKQGGSLPAPVSTLVTTSNFSFIVGLLRLFVGPAMTDREEYHRDRPQSAASAKAMRRRAASGRAFAGMSRRAISRMTRPRTLANSDKQSAVALSLTQFMFAPLLQTTTITGEDEGEGECSASRTDSKLNGHAPAKSAEDSNCASSGRYDMHWMAILHMYRELYYTGGLNTEGVATKQSTQTPSPADAPVPLEQQRRFTTDNVSTLRPSVARESRKLLEDVLLGHCYLRRMNKCAEQGRIVVPPHLWPRVFEEVLFPLVSGEVVRAGSGVYGSASHLRAVTLLSRTVLHNFERLARLDEFYVIWLKLVGILTTLLRRRPSDNNYGGGQDSLRPYNSEHDGGAISDNSMNSMDASISLDTTARESLKNLLLVAHHSGLLEQVSEDKEASMIKTESPARDIWGPTWALVGSVSLPLCQEIERATRPVIPNGDTGAGAAGESGNGNGGQGQRAAEVPNSGIHEPTLGSETLAAAAAAGAPANPVSSVRNENDQTTAPPILELDIKLAGGSSAALAVRPGDVPQEVARTFALQHNLSLEKQQKLTRVIEASLAVPQ